MFAVSGGSGGTLSGYYDTGLYKSDGGYKFYKIKYFYLTTEVALQVYNTSFNPANRNCF